MKKIILTVIGGGSVNWMRGLMRDVYMVKGVDGGEIRLVDPNVPYVTSVRNMLLKFNELTGKDFKVSIVEDRLEALKNSDFVLTTFSPGAMDAFYNDLEIPVKYGVRLPVSMTCGVSGISASLRTVPVAYEISQQMEQVCPNAILMNVTNPMTAVTKAFYLPAKTIKVYGLCHEINALERLLSNIFGLKKPENMSITEYLHSWLEEQGFEYTIQGKLEQLISRMCNEKIEIQGSGRTDAGVHALGQVINFHTHSEMPVEQMLAYMNQYLPEDIAVVEIEEVPERFHSRLNAKGKQYSYRVWNSSIPNVFWRRYAYTVEADLDVEAMEEAARHLLGEHDFKSFTSTKKGKKSTVRRIDSIHIKKDGDLLTFTFRGDGFLYHMIRILMGTLLEVGMGQRSAASIPEVLAAKDREKAGVLVPGKGLVLEKVFY